MPGGEGERLQVEQVRTFAAFEPAPIPEGMVVLASEAGDCTKNAYLFALANRLTLCRGYALLDTPIDWIPHMWCVDAEGHALDPTWEFGAARAYVGERLDLDSAFVYDEDEDEDGGCIELGLQPPMPATWAELNRIAGLT
jgi:hypothetical protein